MAEGCNAKNSTARAVACMFFATLTSACVAANGALVTQLTLSLSFSREIRIIYLFKKKTESNLRDDTLDVIIRRRAVGRLIENNFHLENLLESPDERQLFRRFNVKTGAEELRVDVFHG